MILSKPLQSGSLLMITVRGKVKEAEPQPNKPRLIYKATWFVAEPPDEDVEFDIDRAIDERQEQEERERMDPSADDPEDLSNYLD